MLAAVRSGHVHAAGLDSFASEPMLPDHPFHDQSGIILTPHVGGVTSDTYVKLGVTAVRNARGVLERLAPEAVI